MYWTRRGLFCTRYHETGLRHGPPDESRYFKVVMHHGEFLLYHRLMIQGKIPPYVTSETHFLIYGTRVFPARDADTTSMSRR